MRSVFFPLALIVGGIVMLPSSHAAAADLGLTRSPAYSRTHALPFPRSARAAAVWDEGACWEDCQRTCTWGLAGCQKVDTQGRCLDDTDACDRSCQRECRTRGGPLVGDIFDDYSAR